MCDHNNKKLYEHRLCIYFITMSYFETETGRTKSDREAAMNGSRRHFKWRLEMPPADETADFVVKTSMIILHVRAFIETTSDTFARVG